MRVLVHLGLNKCASTYIQRVLAHNRAHLADRGTLYPLSGSHDCHYGVSRHFGFGPDDESVVPTSVEAILQQAETGDVERLILSSEYLSLYCPKAAERLHRALTDNGLVPEYLIYSRPIAEWIEALFNQYVKTVENGRYLRSINDFVDQVLKNKTVDAGRRISMWSDLAGHGGLTHVRLNECEGNRDLLAPFRRFTGCELALPRASRVNESLSKDALFQLGLLRQLAPSNARDRRIERILSGGCRPRPAPAAYLEMAERTKQRLKDEIEPAYLELPSARPSSSPAPSPSGNLIRGLQGITRSAQDLVEKPRGIAGFFQRHQGPSIDVAQPGR